MERRVAFWSSPLSLLNAARVVASNGKVVVCVRGFTCQRSVVSTSCSKQTCRPPYGGSGHFLEEETPGGGGVFLGQELFTPLPISIQIYS